MNMKLRLSQLLQRSRMEQGYTQREVAEAVSVSVRWYQKMEAGSKMPSSVTLIRLVLFLSIDMEDLR